VLAVNAASVGLPDAEGLARRQQALEDIDGRGIIATPGNSFINELVVEAARLSITHAGRQAEIAYTPSPHVSLRG
jgi:hypothetical protein